MCHGKPAPKHRPLWKDVYINGYDIIQNWILKPVNSILETKLSFIHSPGIPIIFHSNYLAIRTFSKSILDFDIGDTKGIIEQINLQKDKFNLTTYFTLVSREIIKEFNNRI